MATIKNAIRVVGAALMALWAVSLVFPSSQVALT
jgi:hypothetical protein